MERRRPSIHQRRTAQQAPGPVGWLNLAAFRSNMQPERDARWGRYTMFGIKAGTAFLALAIMAPDAWAEPCGAVPSRSEMSETLGRASATRPVHVTFHTRADGVKMPADLLTQYPDEMTMILQYEFARLAVKDDRFEVLLWFKGRAAQLVVPFASVTAVYDNDVRQCLGE
jgi:hypothetical protein